MARFSPGARITIRRRLGYRLEIRLWLEQVR